MIRLLLTEGSAPARAALRSTLQAAANLEIVGEASNGEELLACLGSAAPTLVLLDLRLPGPDVFTVLAALREQYPRLRVLARGELTNEHYVARAFEQGAHGYLLKKAFPTELLHGLATVALGRPYLCSAMGLALLGRFHISLVPAPDGDAARTVLSRREMEVLSLVAEGLTNSEIALRLFTSKRTIETHRQNIMDKTQTRNTAALIKLAVRQGLC